MEHNAGSGAADTRAFTVTQINEYARMLIDENPVMKNVYVKGEISNFVNHRTGHMYFTLKDDGGVLKSVMFRSNTSKLRFMPENGMRVVAHGKISVFVQGGQYQLYADGLEPDGVGALYIAYEQLKRKLEAEGLFDSSRKKPIPKIPTRVGVITSPTGAAVRDILNITGRRFPYAEVVIFPSLVQGDGAASQLCEGVKYFNRTKRADVIIIGRGGGSIEDLWAFNDETLARTIAASDIPVISAVGHETDFTIADFAADRRAPTPSAAAELAVPDTAVLKRQISNIVGYIEQNIDGKIRRARERLNGLESRRCLSGPEFITEDRRMKLMLYENRLDSAVKNEIGDRREEFVRLTASLRALDPMAVISRGYSAVFSSDGSVIKSVAQLEKGDSFTFKTTDGEVDGIVTDMRKSE